jgi:NAD-dependent deacetylase
MNEESSDLSKYFEVAGSARRCAVLTGAGVSAESGVPTFRGEEGLWKHFRAEELATPEAFARNPELVREWYEFRRSLLSEIEPNEGHRALADAEGAFDEFTLITQNIDGLHARAGSTDVIELHGNIHQDRCNHCGTFRKSDEGLTCRCGGPFRPDVVWFGESLPQEAVERAHAAAQSADLFFSIGTSTQVFPAAHLPYVASDSGAFVVEVNPEATPFTLHADMSIRGPSGEWLPTLLDPLSARTDEVTQ